MADHPTEPSSGGSGDGVGDHARGLDRRLQQFAADLDAMVAPVTAEAAMGPTTVIAPPRSVRPWLVAAATIVVVCLVAVVVGTRSADDDETLRVGDRATTSAPVTGPATSASDPTDPVDPQVDDPPHTYEGIPWSELPDEGISIVGTDTVTLFSVDGEELARVGVAYSSIGPLGLTGLPFLTVSAPKGEGGPVALALDTDLADAPDECEAAVGAGGVRVALCGGSTRYRHELVTVAPSGDVRTLTGPPPGSQREVDADLGIIGHWQGAIVSPDGRWVLGQWSGECETLTGFVISVATGEVRPMSQPDEDLWLDTKVLGWTDTGRALVQFGDGNCGTAIDTPGVYVVDVETLDRSLLIPKPEGAFSGMWRKNHLRGSGERLWDRLLEETGLEGGGDHMGGEVFGLVSWDGSEVPVGAYPRGDPPGVWFNDLVLSSRDGELNRLPVTLGEADQGPFLAFTCGNRTWTIGGAGGGDRATDVQLRELARTLLPYLYCTVGDRPQATGHGDPLAEPGGG